MRAGIQPKSMAPGRASGPEFHPLVIECRGASGVFTRRRRRVLQAALQGRRSAYPKIMRRVHLYVHELVQNMGQPASCASPASSHWRVRVHTRNTVWNRFESANGRAQCVRRVGALAYLRGSYLRMHKPVIVSRTHCERSKMRRHALLPPMHATQLHIHRPSGARRLCRRAS